MAKTLAGGSAIERETRQSCTPRPRPIALVELITTAALAVSTAVAVTAVSIGMARAEAVGAVSAGEAIPFAVALVIGLLLAGSAGVAAIAAARPRRD